MDYKNNEIPLIFKCNNEHVFKKSWSNFHSNPICSKCKKEEKSQKQFLLLKELVESNGGKILSNKYINSVTPIDFICGCGRKYSLTSTKIKLSKGFCPLCHYERSAKKLSHNYEDVNEFFKQNNCILITKNYINSKQLLEFVCFCGNTYKKSFNDFMNSPMCGQCGFKNVASNPKYTFEQIFNFYKENNCKLLISKDEYKNKLMHADFICSCGKRGNRQIKQFYKTPYCKKCGIEMGKEVEQYIYDRVKIFVEENNCKLLTTNKEYKNTLTYLDIKCFCGNIFKTSFINFKHENKRQCNDCGINLRSGENSPLWNGGLSSERDIVKNSDEYKLWRNKVYKRDNYTCQCCGDNSGGNLQAHHIYNFSEFINLRLDVENGITLCDLCHNFNKYGSFHHIYRANNNTLEQLEEYIKRYKSGEFDELRSKNYINNIN